MALSVYHNLIGRFRAHLLFYIPIRTNKPNSVLFGNDNIIVTRSLLRQLVLNLLIATNINCECLLIGINDELFLVRAVKYHIGHVCYWVIGYLEESDLVLIWESSKSRNYMSLWKD